MTVGVREQMLWLHAWCPYPLPLTFTKKWRQIEAVKIENTAVKVHSFARTSQDGQGKNEGEESPIACAIGDSSSS